MRGFLKSWLPPALINIYRKYFLRNKVIRYLGFYSEWSKALNASVGYDSDGIVQKVRRASLKVKSGEAAYERDSVLFDSPDYPFPLLTGLLHAAIESKSHLHVLDFGGALGSSYFQCKKLLPAMSELTWSVIEQEKFVGYGKSEFSSDELYFYYNLNEYSLWLEKTKRHVSAVLFSSVLQYLDNPHQVINDVLDMNAPYIIIDRTPFYSGSDDFITVQHVPLHIYKASYPCRIYARNKFIEAFASKYTVVALFDTEDEGAVVNGIPFKFQGMILKKNEKSL